MNREEVRSVFLKTLTAIAPGADAASVDPVADLREEMHPDSMDMLTLFIAPHKRLDIDLSEIDTAKLVTVDNAVDCLVTKVKANT